MFVFVCASRPCTCTPRCSSVRLSYLLINTQTRHGFFFSFSFSLSFSHFAFNSHPLRYIINFPMHDKVPHVIYICTRLIIPSMFARYVPYCWLSRWFPSCQPRAIFPPLFSPSLHHLPLSNDSPCLELLLY